MHEYVMPVARRSALRRRGRRPAGTTRRRAHGAIPPNKGATRQARAGPPAVPIIAANPAPTADTATSPTAPPVRISGDVFACPTGRRTGLPNTGDGRAGVARCTTGDGGERRLARPCARHDAAPAGTPARECATRGRHPPERTALARNRRDYDRARRVEDQLLRQDEPPKGRARGRPTRRRDATRGALADLHARRADAPRSPAPARPASPGRETLIATE
ncbi:hypothetical protein DO72_3078 [Burkholderia pseudomallei]|nr:hypothetical protein X978_4403 [Burkholderia pseudomallei MSHR3965]AJX19247.1 hypothetical protein BG17_4552 [Burkholderia pseudomallei MSHR491]KGD39014.1 hypothetical protein DO72_3078 [Burkholderia pseudomallei]KGW90970.1 hypothetical protein Y034_2101 [Burkholderia pseudomallei MSHR449]KGX74871.1 hypothetical protein Y033_1317 [Burkholderia pseudomallei MSHR435]